MSKMGKNIRIILSFFVFLNITAATVYAELDYEISGGVRESFDDNVTYAETNEKDDFVTGIFLGGKGIYETYGHIFDLGGKVTQHIYAKNSDFNFNSQDLTATYEGRFSKFLKIDFNDRFTHTEEPRNFDDELGRTAGRYTYYRNTATLIGTFDVNKNFQCALGYGHDWKDISKGSSDPDSQEHSGRISGIYFFSTANIVTLFYEVAHRTYDPGDDITRQSVFLNGRHYFEPYFYMDAGVGYDFFDSRSTETEPQFSIAVTNEFNETTYLTAEYVKRYYVQTYTEDLFDEWRTNLTFGHQLYERINLSFSGFVGRGEFQITKARDTFYGARGEISYDITEHVRGYVSYAYRTVESNRPTREYDRNLISIGISMTI